MAHWFFALKANTLEIIKVLADLVLLGSSATKEMTILEMSDKCVLGATTALLIKTNKL